ncbi:MATE family efflux transporter [Vibrio mimicus]|uniref:MATE family efflux transporter n=1 Tax=Vibrio mimicus TaxID=674 RepID=UPI0002BC51BE|nr:MATE family efflux transporter [Vibrio mimicus]EMB48983.1 adhesin [Vibrio mimicus CAIM 602]MBY7675409.1 MATE family efflux transporter [Vibrio mimicus]MBY7727344.1 MATE family efflux transporter [Vibrio mimicus]TXY26225.1 MATE family efflux transporter [Vibrio mimicus]TXY29914.1 MATE family efflux transporter [Vibrio mimicus]
MIVHFRQLDRPFWQKLLQIGLPVSMQSMLFSLLGVVDIFMVSQLGESATAAVGVGNRIFFFNLIVIVGASGAVSVLAAQYFGAGNLDGVRRTLAQSWMMAIVLTLPFALIYTLMPETIVALVADEPQYVAQATDYLWVTGISLFCTALVVPLEGALRSIGEAKLPTRVSIFAIIVNAILNALLIFGLFGFPELGVLGAGLGTTLSRLFQTALLFVLVKRRYTHLLPNQNHWQESVQRRHRQRYLTVAWPMLIHDSAWAAGLLVYNVIVGQLGVSELAIISLLAPIESVLISAFLGFAVAASIILGNEIGAQNYQRVENTAWWYVITSCSLALLLALLCMAAKPLLAWVISHSPLENHQLALNVCLVMAFGMVFKVFNMVGIGGVLKSGGDIRYSIFIDLFGQWAVGIPLAYLTGIVWGWPLHGVLMIIWLEELVKMGLTAQRISSKRWINNLVSEPASEVVA